MESVGGYMNAQLFVASRYVDIGALAGKKRDSILTNKFIGHYAEPRDEWDKMRGMEYGWRRAEAFVQMSTVGRMNPDNLYPNKWVRCGLQPFRD